MARPPRSRDISQLGPVRTAVPRPAQNQPKPPTKPGKPEQPKTDGPPTPGIRGAID
jgi:hypothetical protein